MRVFLFLEQASTRCGFWCDTKVRSLQTFPSSLCIHPGISSGSDQQRHRADDFATRLLTIAENMLKLYSLEAERPRRSETGKEYSVTMSHISQSRTLQDTSASSCISQTWARCLLILLESPSCTLNGVAEQHCDGHGTHTSRHRSYVASMFAGLFEVHISH